MSRPLLCDVCGQPIEKVKLKLYKAPKTNGATDHTSYTDHADVGECCVVKINAINWQRRKVLLRKDASV